MSHAHAHATKKEKEKKRHHHHHHPSPLTTRNDLTKDGEAGWHMLAADSLKPAIRSVRDYLEEA